jgi:hypothetical protein
MYETRKRLRRNRRRRYLKRIESKLQRAALDRDLTGAPPEHNLPARPRSYPNPFWTGRTKTFQPFHAVSLGMDFATLERRLLGVAVHNHARELLQEGRVRYGRVDAETTVRLMGHLGPEHREARRGPHECSALLGRSCAGYLTYRSGRYCAYDPGVGYGDNWGSDCARDRSVYPSCHHSQREPLRDHSRQSYGRLRRLGPVLPPPTPRLPCFVHA